jgi:hypothetical protein
VSHRPPITVSAERNDGAEDVLILDRRVRIGAGIALRHKKAARTRTLAEVGNPMNTEAIVNDKCHDFADTVSTGGIEPDANRRACGDRPPHARTTQFALDDGTRTPHQGDIFKDPARIPPYQ